MNSKRNSDTLVASCVKKVMWCASRLCVHISYFTGTLGFPLCYLQLFNFYTLFPVA